MHEAEGWVHFTLAQPQWEKHLSSGLSQIFGNLVLHPVYVCRCITRKAIVKANFKMLLSWMMEKLVLWRSVWLRTNAPRDCYWELWIGVGHCTYNVVAHLFPERPIVLVYGATFCFEIWQKRNMSVKRSGVTVINISHQLVRDFLLSGMDLHRLHGAIP